METLTSADRCDKCVAQAYIRVSHTEGFDLYFCGHHYNKYGEALSAQGFSIVMDTRDLLTRKAVAAEVR